MDFVTSIKTVLAKYAVFEGRARRSEFWWWILAMWILQIIVNVIFGGISGNRNGFLAFIGWVITIILVLATIAVGCRRLHDTGKSGWLQLLYIIPCIGPIILIVFWAQAGNPGDNTYGPPPAY